MNQYNELKETATVLAFLAYMMNNAPDTALLEKLRENYKNDPSDSAEIEEFWQKHKDSGDKKIVEDMAADWARLFRGTLPGNVQKPPYAGIFISKDGLGTEIMVALKYMYDNHSFTPTKEDRMDYLGIILDFMAGLLGSYASFAEKGQTAEAESCLRTLKEVCLKYTNTWLKTFGDQTLKNAQNPLYREYILTLTETVNDISAMLLEAE